MRLHYCIYPNPDKPLLMISPGRMEATLKYRELAMDFWHQGYQVIVLDHRGQGLSQRFFNQRRVGHMDNFEHAAVDIITLAERCQLPGQQIFVAGHSMGASVLLRAMQLRPRLFSSAALIAPMLSLPLRMPVFLAQLFSGIRATYDQLRWRSKKQVPGFISRSRRDYKDPGFSANLFSSSKVRYCAFRALYEQVPELKLGGPTAGWLYQAIGLMQRILANSHQLQTPILMITAGQEKIVTRHGQDQLRRQLTQANQPIHWLLLDQARHEIFEEGDEIRSAAINAMLSHFQRSTASSAKIS